MKQNRKIIRIGFAPTRRVLSTPKAFNKEEAYRVKNQIEEYIRKFPDIEIVNIDTINDEGLLYNPADAVRVSELFLREKVDAVFFPHCNFGSEEAVAKVARTVGKPVLIWGPRDEAPDENGVRLRDAQCGMFATTKVLQQFGVKYTYISNCRIGEEIFERGFENFLGAVSVVKALHHLRIGQIGTRPEPFWSVKTNERELMERFEIEIVPVTLAAFEEMLKENLEANKQAIMKAVAGLQQRFPDSACTEADWTSVANLQFTIRKWCEDNQLSAVASECWKFMDAVEIGSAHV